ncbi:porin family protein [Prosthecochloris sp. N3]|uniref:Porin family protein n=1 Tax=Prosthecochloris ethylica TaxID=2743976 RepID=A0ABR9XNV2_9CHLB|nr:MULTISPECIES: outer membrane beta-barrel protein [Prosthecochloris]MBF0585735.1 porin family protein [Prosthecochloris ethylica]MBF0635645.1 porin family protein [Prosthecochloris ethylica]MEC9486563.1 outer membrane beta-barrel protein [Prosthecochloris sp.]NUK46944.1 porin family protein [Prosthecochloris ethylica]
MKKLLCGAVAALCLAPVPAAVAATPYASVSGALSMMGESDVTVNGSEYDEGADFSPGYGIDLALGLDAGTLRLEGEVGYQMHELDSVSQEVMDDFGPFDPDIEDLDAEVLTVMANAYVEAGVPGSLFQPYVMGGLGLASIDFELGEWSEDDTVFAWQAGAGIGIRLLPNMVLDLGYRYFAMDDPEVSVDGYGIEADLDSHNVVAGIRAGIF